MNKHSIKEPILYGLFGLLTTLLNIVVFLLLSERWDWPYMAANGAAMFLSVAFAFITNKFIVFRSTDACFSVLRRELFNFLGTRLLTSLVDMGVMYLLVSILETDKRTAKAVTSVVVISLNYVFSKLWVFRKDGFQK